MTREKQIKCWLRRKKVALVESVNPSWVDLASEWEETPQPLQALRPDPSGLRETSEGRLRPSV